MKSFSFRFFLLFVLMQWVSMEVNAQRITDLQPFSFKIKTLLQTLGYLGEPININDQEAINKPFWNIERTRIGDTRTVPVELVVNGLVVASKNIVADGNINDVFFDTPIAKSSWVAICILYSSHSNPVFVIIDNKSIRASAKSAEWCLRAVDQCWSQKSPKFSASDKKDAEQVYNQAKEIYKRILSESK